MLYKVLLLANMLLLSQAMNQGWNTDYNKRGTRCRNLKENPARCARQRKRFCDETLETYSKKDCKRVKRCCNNGDGGYGTPSPPPIYDEPEVEPGTCVAGDIEFPDDTMCYVTNEACFTDSNEYDQDCKCAQTIEEDIFCIQDPGSDDCDVLQDCDTTAECQAIEGLDEYGCVKCDDCGSEKEGKCYPPCDNFLWSVQPTAAPTEDPTENPTDQPTEEPTDNPTDQPTEEPTDEPTEDPTRDPTADPTKAYSTARPSAPYGKGGNDGCRAFRNKPARCARQRRLYCKEEFNGGDAAKCARVKRCCPRDIDAGNCPDADELEFPSDTCDITEQTCRRSSQEQVYNMPRSGRRLAMDGGYGDQCLCTTTTDYPAKVFCAQDIDDELCDYLEKCDYSSDCTEPNAACVECDKCDSGDMNGVCYPGCNLDETTTTTSSTTTTTTEAPETTTEAPETTTEAPETTPGTSSQPQTSETTSTTTTTKYDNGDMSTTPDDGSGGETSTTEDLETTYDNGGGEMSTTPDDGSGGETSTTEEIEETTTTTEETTTKTGYDTTEDMTRGCNVVESDLKLKGKCAVPRYAVKCPEAGAYESCNCAVTIDGDDFCYQEQDFCSDAVACDAENPCPSGYGCVYCGGLFAKKCYRTEENFCFPKCGLMMDQQPLFGYAN